MNKVSVLLLLHSKGQVACLRLRAGRRSRSMHSRFRLHNLGGGKKKSKHLPRPEKCCHKPVTKRATRIFQGAEKSQSLKSTPLVLSFWKLLVHFLLPFSAIWKPQLLHQQLTQREPGPGGVQDKRPHHTPALCKSEHKCSTKLPHWGLLQHT